MKSAAKALIFNPAGQLLVLRRSMTHPLYSSHLDFPGGELEDHEKPERATTRETLEETGLDITKADLELVLEEKITDDITHFIYRAQLDENIPTITLSWEHDAYQWYHPDELMSLPMPPNVDRFYKTALSYLAESAITS